MSDMSPFGHIKDRDENKIETFTREEQAQLFSSKELRIASFLAKGVPASQVSTIVGVTPAFISQLCSEAATNKNFLKLLEQKKREEFVEEKEKSSEAIEDEVLTAKYLSLEHRVLQHLERNLEGADIKEATRVLEVLGNRQEKRALRVQKVASLGLSSFSGQHPTTTVTINIPAFAAPSLTLNQNKEVLAINDEPMAPMTSDGVRLLFSARKEDREGVISHV